jgi:hypothetical protein
MNFAIFIFEIFKANISYTMETSFVFSRDKNNGYINKIVLLTKKHE